jgi:uncharacterized protein (DUF608 family)
MVILSNDVRNRDIIIIIKFKEKKMQKLFDFPRPGQSRDWIQFQAAGYSEPVCGVVYRLADGVVREKKVREQTEFGDICGRNNEVTNGMPLGGIDTGCIDLETSGMLGYCSIFNTLTPRRGPLNVPILGLSVEGRTWVMCDPQFKDGVGGFQPSAAGRQYQLWRGNEYVKTTELITPIPREGKFDGLGTAREIHYWGHYPIADLEFETDAPIEVGLRAWSPFLPGNVVDSMLPGAVFEVHLRNTSDETQAGTLAFSFPGPLEKEAGASQFHRQTVEGEFTGVEVTAPLASYALGVIGKDKVRLGGDLAGEGVAWSKIGRELPAADASQAGTCVGIDFSLASGESKVVRFVLAWYAPDWNAGGYNWSGSPHTFTHMYAKHYPNARQTAQTLARNHETLLRRIIAWQQVIYTESALPVWLRESLVNVLHLLTETSMWAQAKPPLPDWVRAEDGLFGLTESPRFCPQIECIPCSFYGNQPVVYFFPQLALSTLRGYLGYQTADGAAPFVWGQSTEFARPNTNDQRTTNGISLAAMVDRYFLCHGDREKDFVREFYPMLKKSMIYTVNLRPSYSIGDRIIAMPAGDTTGEWFEVDPGWYGMTAHVGGLHLAQLRITERLAKAAGDEAFADQCAEWIKAGARSMEEKLWTGSYYLNYWEPETNNKSELVFGYQLDGEWITDHHGLAGTLPSERVAKVLETIKRCNVALSKYAAVNYAMPDGRPAGVGGYGTYSFFPPEGLMLAMTYIYKGQQEFGLELARKNWHNLVCRQGYTWDMPNIMRGDADTGERRSGADYSQDMMLWSLPAAVEGKDFGSPAKPGGLVDRVMKAAETSCE